MAEMILKGAWVALLDSAAQQVTGLEQELARLAQQRDTLNAAIQQGIREAIQQRGVELPERWEAEPVEGGIRVVWDDDELRI